jgi:hypothetical protein
LASSPPDDDSEVGLLISQAKHYAERQLRIMREIDLTLDTLNKSENRENQESGARAKSTLRIL